MEQWYASGFFFNALWAADYFHDSLLVFSTGRSPTDEAGEDAAHAGGHDVEIVRRCHGREPNKGWDRAEQTAQRPHKVSFKLKKAEDPRVVETLLKRLIECEVGNAVEDLTQWYLDNAKDNPKIFRGTERCASGILQAIREFKFDPCVSPRDADLLSQLTAG
ncbi:sucrose-phosphatase 2-like [Selaginella moellendorffii]|uniref:sucrose-phosphatase 2-like n=1 Tax=Selaginella moellendorffii TaxID=88036 RepID=UPI000D1C4F05|nr:sucrose-phosphatase 2-like [Selaginella moellendorffii]|eukprot:XP_024540828.1 sucrose-phosphatase 2-like [Selaginella moellendorffii]